MGQYCCGYLEFVHVTRLNGAVFGLCSARATTTSRADCDAGLGALLRSPGGSRRWIRTRYLHTFFPCCPPCFLRCSCGE